MNTSLQLLEDICAEIYERWDKDMRSGKLLQALAGALPKYRADVDAVREALLLEETWLVYSNQNRAWWRANSMGYTTDIRGAGLYTREQAIDISATSRDGWTSPSDLPCEIAVPLSAIPEAIRKTMIEPAKQ